MTSSNAAIPFRNYISPHRKLAPKWSHHLFNAQRSPRSVPSFAGHSSEIVYDARRVIHQPACPSGPRLRPTMFVLDAEFARMHKTGIRIDLTNQGRRIFMLYRLQRLETAHNEETTSRVYTPSQLCTGIIIDLTSIKDTFRLSSPFIETIDYAEIVSKSLHST